MPTYNRRAFVPQSIAYFLRQDYENKELIIVDDGDDSVEDLVPKDERIRYVRLSQRATVGAKRNLACEHAAGEVIVHWDDDDWYAPHRLRYQLELLLRSGADISGVNNPLFYDMETKRAWQYFYPAHLKPWLAGSALCYRRAFWQSHRFANIDIGEDAYFVWAGRSDRLAQLCPRTGLIQLREFLSWIFFAPVRWILMRL